MCLFTILFDSKSILRSLSKKVFWHIYMVKNKNALLLEFFQFRPILEPNTAIKRKIKLHSNPDLKKNNKKTGEGERQSYQTTLQNELI